jgi:HTH-type transcriptional regulator/antitoxin MqsA
MDRLSKEENLMFKCHVCGSEESHSEFINEVFNIQGRFYLVENIPAMVCSHCGEEVFSRETTEQVRVILQEPKQPSRSIPLDVFSFDEAI